MRDPLCGGAGGAGAFYACLSRDDLTRLAVPEDLSAVPGDSVIQGCVVAAEGYFCAGLGEVREIIHTTTTKTNSAELSRLRNVEASQLPTSTPLYAKRRIT